MGAKISFAILPLIALLVGCSLHFPCQARNEVPRISQVEAQAIAKAVAARWSGVDAIPDVLWASLEPLGTARLQLGNPGLSPDSRSDHMVWVVTLYGPYFHPTCAGCFVPLPLPDRTYSVVVDATSGRIDEIGTVKVDVLPAK